MDDTFLREAANEILVVEEYLLKILKNKNIELLKYYSILILKSIYCCIIVQILFMMRSVFEINYFAV